MSKAIAEIIVVEDEAITAEDLKSSLEELNYTVSAVVGSGEEALERIEENKPDLVLIDILLQGKIDGIETTKKINTLFNIPVVYLTAHTDNKTLERAKNTDPYGYIIKPFDDRELQATIKMALHKHKMEKALKESEEKYRSLFESESDAILLVDLETLDILDSNPAANKLYGYTQEEFKKLRASDLSAEPEKTIKILKDKGEGHIPIRYHKKKDGTIFPVEISAGSYELYGRKVNVSTIRDITESKKAEEALQKSEERFREIIENSRDILYRQNFNTGAYDYISPSMEKVLGFAPEEIMNMGIEGEKKLIHPEDLPRLLNFRDDLLEADLEGKNVERQFRVKNKSGQYRWINGNYFLTRDADGHPQFIIGNLRDVTNRKQAEEDLIRAEEEWNNTFNSIIDFVSVHDKDFKFVKVNQALSDFLGMKPEELIGKYCYEVFHNRAEPWPSCPHVKTLKLKKAVTEEVDDPNIGCPLLVSTSPIFDTNGELIASIHIAKDITERKKVEEALQKAHDELEQRVEGRTADLMAEITERKRAEKTIKRRLGFEKIVSAVSSRFVGISDMDEAINASLSDIGHLSGASRAYLFLFREDGTLMDNTHEWCAEGVNPQIDNLQNLPSEMFPWWMKKLRKGEVIHIKEVSKMPKEAKAEKEILESQDIKSLLVLPLHIGGKLAGFMGFDNVIRTREWSEDDLVILRMSSEIIGNAFEREKAGQVLEKYRILLSQTDDLTFICDTKGNVLFANEAFEKLTNHKPEEFFGKPFAPLFDNENLVKGMDGYTRTLKGESPRFEARFKDTGILCEYKNMPLRDEKGDIVGVMGIARDITERKRAEDALRESEEKYRSIFENINDMVVYVDRYGKVLNVNKRIREVLGYHEDAVIGKNFAKIGVLGVKDLPEMVKMFKEAVSRGRTLRVIELELRHKNGKMVSFEVNTRGIKKNGKVEGFLSIFRDITERKRADDEMKRQLMKFKLKEGNLYLVKENIPSLSIEALKDLLKVGYSGVIISRMPGEKFKTIDKSNVEFLWISERSGKNALLPSLGEIELRIESLPKKSAVLIERLDYLVFKNSFEETLSFVQRLSELAYIMHHVVILSVDPSTFAKRELRLLEKETAEVEVLHKTRLPEDLFETLRFIYLQNNIGVKPSHSDVGLEFRISRPTVIKRIGQLVAAGYVIDIVKGNRKILEITEKGRRLFLK